ncbi:MAG TPA: RNA polymerase sigma factor [Gemmataceae bacterium]|nr:RNA polymerase sigma factor [Gemmataceae bacterium]
MMGPDQFGLLVDRHAAALALYARQWCSTPEDVVQEAFLKLVKQCPAPRNVVPWLFRVVRNGAISVARSEKRRRRYETAAAEELPAWFESNEGTGLDGEAAAAALRNLTPEERETITLHLWGGLTFEEIAQVAECSSSTAHRWYASGLESLRERLHVHVRNQF